MLGTGFYVFKALLRVKTVDATRLCHSVADAGSTATLVNKVYLKKDPKCILRQIPKYCFFEINLLTTSHQSFYQHIEYLYSVGVRVKSIDCRIGESDLTDEFRGVVTGLLSVEDW